MIGGNIATGAAALALVEAGADGVKVGIGPGLSAPLASLLVRGVPQITAIDNVATALQGTGVPLIADGGIRYSGDIARSHRRRRQRRDDGWHVCRYGRSAWRSDLVPRPAIRATAAWVRSVR